MSTRGVKASRHPSLPLDLRLLLMLIELSEVMKMADGGAGTSRRRIAQVAGHQQAQTCEGSMSIGDPFPLLTTVDVALGIRLHNAVQEAVIEHGEAAQDTLDANTKRALWLANNAEEMLRLLDALKQAIAYQLRNGAIEENALEGLYRKMGGDLPV